MDARKGVAKGKDHKVDRQQKYETVILERILDLDLVSLGGRLLAFWANDSLNARG